MSPRVQLGFVSSRVSSVTRATLVNELVGRGEKMLRDGLQSATSNPSKLNEGICSQLCVEGLEALDRASRYALKKKTQPNSSSTHVS